MLASVCLLAPSAQLALASDPVDPAGNPIQQSGTGTLEAGEILQMQQVHATFQRGDVFVAVSDGRVQWHLPDGTLNAVLDTGEGGFTTGMAFNDRGHLFVTGFSTGKIYEFDTSGQLVGVFATVESTDCQPESIVFDAAGDMYVGLAGCSRDVLKYAPDGNLLARFDVAVERRGADWIDLEPNQCRLRYTSEGTRVLRYDVCDPFQLGDWGGGLTVSFALRILPDDPFDPDLLVASTQNIRRMHFGLSTTGYDAPGEDCWFALNLDPDATSFWSADVCTSNVYRFDILSGDLLSSFNTGTPSNTVFGLAIFGELGTSTVRDCSTENLSGAFGEVLPTQGGRVTVRYDARFLVDESRDLFAAEARAIAEKLQERAERALDWYGTKGLVQGEQGLGFELPEAVLIEIVCQPMFGPLPIDTDGFVGGPGHIQLRLERIKNELGAAAITGFPAGGNWDKDGAGWKNLIDHEVFHTVQFEYRSLLTRFLLQEQTLIESPAVLAQDLFPDTDDLAQSEYLQRVARFALTKPSLDIQGWGDPAGYDAPGIFQYWGERFGPQDQPNLERRVADFAKVLIGAAGQPDAYSEAIGSDALPSLRDYYIAHYGLRASNISAAVNAEYAILDAETTHGQPAGQGSPAGQYAPLVAPVQIDLSAGGATMVSLRPWQGDVVEIINIPSDATHVALHLDSGWSGLLNRGFLSAILPINPGEEFILDPQLMPEGPNVFRPIEKRIPVVGRDRLAIAFVNGNSVAADYQVTAQAVRGQPGMEFVDPTGADPHRIASTAQPILLEVVPTLDGEPVPGDLPRSAFKVSVGQLDATLSGMTFQNGVYHLTVWAPGSLGPGSYPMIVRFAEADFDVPGGLVIEDTVQPPPQLIRAGSFGELGQGEAASASAIVTPGAAEATFQIEWTGSDFDLTLTAPSGRVIDENSNDPDVTVSHSATSVSIAVSAPEAGTWQLEAFGSDVPAPQPVSYEVSESGAPLLGQLFVADQAEAGLPLDVVFSLGEPTGGIVEGEVVAAVTDPVGTTRTFPLLDDGANGDTDSNDGVYGRRVWATDLSGTYLINVTASGTTSAGAPVQRQASATVSLGPKTDTDGDGVADAAETMFGLDPLDPTDPSIDHDGDGLSLVDELSAGTDPFSWDTDGGKENDRSELAAGRDPLVADDDRFVENVLLGARALDGNLVEVNLVTGTGTGSVHLFRTGPDGTTGLGVHDGAGATITDGPLPDGEYIYFAVAVMADGAESIPYVTGPVTVVADVTPPDFRITLNGGRWQTTDTEVSVTFTDLTESVTEMRLANSVEELASAGWMPFSGFASVTIPPVLGEHFIFAQVRDATGNESRVGSSFVILIDATPPESTAGPLESQYTTDTIDVPFTASDNLSGIDFVELWWRYRPDESSSWTDWTLGPTATSSPIPYTFANGDGFYEFYSVAIDLAGNREEVPAQADAMTQKVSGGEWSDSVRVNDDTGTTQQHRPDIALGPDGAAYLIWDDYRAGTYADIYFSRRDPITQVWGANERVNDDVGARTQWNAALAVDGSDNVYAVWQDPRNSRKNSIDYDIYFSKRSPTGGWTTNLRVNSDKQGAPDQTEPRIAVTSDGTAVAVWIDWRSNQWNIYSARLVAGATAWGSDMRVTSNTSSRKRAPDVAIGQDGTAFAVWADDRDGDWDIWYAVLPPGSSSWTANEKVNDDNTTAAQHTPRVEVDGLGNVTVVWLDDRTGGAREVRARRRAGGTGAWIPSVRVSDLEAQPTSVGFAIRMDGDGYVVWEDVRAGTRDIWGSYYTSSSDTWDAPIFVADESGVGHQRFPTVAMSASEIAVGWVKVVSSDYDIYSRRRMVD